MRQAIMVFVAFTTLAVSAPAEEQRAALTEYYNRVRAYDRARSEAIRSNEWSVVFSRIDAFANGWTVISFGIDFSHRGNEPHAWRAQRRSSQDQGILEIDAVRCPALLEQLARIEQISWPDVDIPRIGQEPPPNTPLSVVLDGETNRLWTRHAVYAPNRAMGEMEVRGNVDTPLAQWGDETMHALEPCWTQSSSR